MSEKRYYWLKLKRDFFKRHDIRIVEAMPNGKDYILFYLKLLLESVDHEGMLRFSDTIPFDDNMLSVITNTNIDVVRSATKILIQLGLMEVLDDQTIYLNEAAKMLETEAWSTERSRISRESKKTLPNALQCNTDATKCNEEIEKEKEIEIDTENRERKRSNTRFVKPSVEEIALYCQERGNRINADHFFDWYESKGWYIGNKKMVDWKAAVRTWEAKDKHGGKSQVKTITERLADL